jgi:L-ascorbate metabolism protein UlaG (beta-lactamase superfamily)
MNRTRANHAGRAVDKSTFAATPVTTQLATSGVTRRGWLGWALGTSAVAATAELASLGGAWDHRALTLAAPQPAPLGAGPGTARLIHVGHCCHLIEMSGQRWLTDPWFFNPAFGSLTHTSALRADAVGALDGIFISHRHPDHFDLNALAQLDRRARVWTPDESVLAALRGLGFASVSLSSPWQTLALGDVEVSFVPAVHDVPEHSLMLAGHDARVLFCGDTGAHEHWAEIRRRYWPATALLPCDGTALRWEARQIMNPAEAARAARELGCPQLLQTHADASYTDPIARYLLSSTEEAPGASLERALAQAREGVLAQAREGALAQAREGVPQPAAGSPDLAPQLTRSVSHDFTPQFLPLAIGETRPLAAALSTTIRG